MSSGPRGFTLVETIVCTALLTGALLAGAELVAFSAARIAGAAQRTLAAIFAEQKLEQLRAELVLDEGGGVEHLDETGTVRCDAVEICTGGVFERRWWVGAAPIAPARLVVVVQVRRAGQGGTPVRLTTLRPRRLR